MNLISQGLIHALEIMDKNILRIIYSFNEAGHLRQFWLWLDKVKTGSQVLRNTSESEVIP